MSTSLEIECARTLADRARAARTATRQQRRAAARRFVRRHRRDPAYLRWVLRSAGASSALAIALLGLATPAHATVPAFGDFTPNPLAGPDVGANSAPSLVDLDGDGDLDLVAGAYDGLVRYFANTGTATAPAFATTGPFNPFGLVGAIGGSSSPALGDLDGDGDFDLLVGLQGGTFTYFQNTGTRSSPAFVRRTGPANPLDGVDIATSYVYTVPALGDFDLDGDLDLIASGKPSNRAEYFRNTGTALAPAFTALTAPLRNPVEDERLSNPAAADLDGDGDLDLVDQVLVVRYAPEPGRGLMFGAGALLLGLLARWRHPR